VVFNNLNTRDVEAARSFYGSLFGWQTAGIGGGAEGWTLPGYGDWLEREHHPGLRRQMAEAGAPEGFEDVVGSIIPIPDEQADTPAHWSVTFASADADATAAKATELGGKVIVAPFDAPWSTSTYTIRMTVTADPQGATFSSVTNDHPPAQARASGHRQPVAALRAPHLAGQRRRATFDAVGTDRGPCTRLRPPSALDAARSRWREALLRARGLDAHRQRARRVAHRSPHRRVRTRLSATARITRSAGATTAEPGAICCPSTDAPRQHRTPHLGRPLPASPSVAPELLASETAEKVGWATPPNNSEAF
jgi:predicted enzyme related to lactoylglutathione lyase